MNETPHKNNKINKAVDAETLHDLLNNYAHGATTQQCADGAGVDYDTADQIIVDAINKQNNRT